MPLELWLAYAATSAVVLAIPGPTILLVLSYSISHGRAAALPLVAGVALGDSLAITLSLIGLGTLLAASAFWFTVIKWLGGLYLIFLGIQLVRGAGNPPPAQAGRVIIGNEGALVLGGLAASAFGNVLAAAQAGAWLVWPAMALAGMLAGGVWIGLVGLLREKREVNETISLILDEFEATIGATVAGVLDAGSRRMRLLLARIDSPVMSVSALDFSEGADYLCAA